MTTPVPQDVLSRLGDDLAGVTREVDRIRAALLSLRPSPEATPRPAPPWPAPPVSPVPHPVLLPVGPWAPRGPWAPPGPPPPPRGAPGGPPSRSVPAPAPRRRGAPRGARCATR